jgi:intracellular septation protein A
MGVHNNVHIPRESWPHFTWLAIEFFIVMAVAALSAREIVNVVAKDMNPDMQNWIFFGVIGVIYLVWYIGIRWLILKKKILETRW